MTRADELSRQGDLFGPAVPDAGHGPDAATDFLQRPTATQVLDLLRTWVDAGWLRALDAALATALLEQCPLAGAEFVVATTLLAHAEGRGHTCLPLDRLLQEGREASVLEPWIAGPAAAQQALRMLLERLGGDLAHWTACLVDSGAVDRENVGGTWPAAPLVLREDGRLYLRRHHRDECEVAAALRERVSDDPQATAVEAVPDAASVAQWLSRLFGARSDVHFDWQRAACAVALRRRLALITGGPGTGKTYTVARLLALVFALRRRPDPLRIALAAPTGKAAARLAQSISAALDALASDQPDLLDWAALRAAIGQPWTLHKLLGARPDTRAFRHDAHRPLEVDLLVVDEASMVHLEMMAALLRALPPGARLVLLGDQEQLASVEAGAVLGDLCGEARAGHFDDDTVAWIAACTGQQVPADLRLPVGREATVLARQTVMLRHSHRFTGAIGALAEAINAGDEGATRRCLGLDAQPKSLHDGTVRARAGAAPRDVVAVALEGRSGTDASSIGYRDLFDRLRSRPAAAQAAVGGAAAFESWVREVLQAFDRSRVLCAVREGDWGVAGLNLAIEKALRQRGLIPRRGEWYEGRPVMVTRNDPALGVFNGDIGLALQPPHGGPMRVWFLEGGGVRDVMASRLASIETAWAMTVHKSQGSEFGHSVLVLPPVANPVLTRELVYTGVTRARHAFTLMLAQPEVLDGAVRRRTVRASGLRDRLAA